MLGWPACIPVYLYTCMHSACALIACDQSQGWVQEMLSKVEKAAKELNKGCIHMLMGIMVNTTLATLEVAHGRSSIHNSEWERLDHFHT